MDRKKPGRKRSREPQKGIWTALKDNAALVAAIIALFGVVITGAVNTYIADKNQRTQEAVEAPRLNPFVFPSDTDLRFVLVVISVLGTSVFIYIWLHIVVFLAEYNEAIRRCPASGGVEALKCVEHFRHAEFLWTTSGIGLLLVVAGAIYWAMPALRIRRNRLVPLTEERAPGVGAYLQELCREAGLPLQPTFLVNPRNASASGLAFGRRGRRYVSLNVGLLMKFYTDRPTFRAIVLHELAHLRNADVDKTYFSVAVGVAFAIVALVPFLSSLVYAYVVGRSGGGPGLAFRYAGPILLLVGLVYLTLAAVLRARELYADVRASVWDGPSGALAGALSAQQPSDGGRWRVLRRFHPGPEQRLRAITATDQLFRMGFWDAFATGVTAMVAVPAFHYALDLVLPLSLWLWGSMLSVLLVVPLVVGLGAWRGAFAALARGEVPRGTRVLGLGLGLGIIVGLTLSPETVAPSGALPALSMAALTLFVLDALVLVGVVLFVRWISAGASAWLELVTTRRSLRLIVLLGLITGALILTLCLGGWLLLFEVPSYVRGLVDWATTSPGYAPPNTPVTIIVIFSVMSLLNSLSFWLVLVALWVFPLAASLWHRRMSGLTPFSVPDAMRV